MSEIECHPITIIYRGERREFTLRHGVSLQLLDRECPWLMERLDCRKAECGLCLVKVVEGMKNTNEPLFGEQMTLKAMGALGLGRLVCQTRVFGPLVVEIVDPEDSSP